jgi:hypothetical protein
MLRTDASRPASNSLLLPQKVIRQPFQRRAQLEVLLRLDHRAIALRQFGHDGAGKIAVHVEDGPHVLAGDQHDPAFLQCPGGHEVGRILDCRGQDEA